MGVDKIFDTTYLLAGDHGSLKCVTLHTKPRIMVQLVSLIYVTLHVKLENIDQWVSLKYVTLHIYELGIMDL